MEMEQHEEFSADKGENSNQNGNSPNEGVPNFQESHQPSLDSVFPLNFSLHAEQDNEEVQHNENIGEDKSVQQEQVVQIEKESAIVDNQIAPLRREGSSSHWKAPFPIVRPKPIEILDDDIDPYSTSFVAQMHSNLFRQMEKELEEHIQNENAEIETTHTSSDIGKFMEESTQQISVDEMQGLQETIEDHSEPPLMGTIITHSLPPGHLSEEIQVVFHPPSDNNNGNGNGNGIEFYFFDF
jgi:hypothetical protein